MQMQPQSTRLALIIGWHLPNASVVFNVFCNEVGDWCELTDCIIVCHLSRGCSHISPSIAYISHMNTGRAEACCWSTNDGSVISLLLFLSKTALLGALLFHVIFHIRFI